MRAHIPGAMPDAASPHDYAAVFEGNKQGALVFEDLVRRFAGKIFRAGGIEGERQTTFNLGQREVVDHIIRQINRANGAEPTDEGE